MLGGKSGDFIADRLEDYGIRQDFVRVAGETRSCLAIITDDGVQTEILEPGPQVSGAELEIFRQKYNELLEAADIIVASGSVPRGVPTDFYARLIQEARAAAKPFLLDTSGELLRQGIAARPFFIKPNRDEIEALTGRRITTEAETAAEVRRFLEQGISLAVVSLGAQGSIAGYEGRLYRVTVPKIEAVNPVGSGDSYVAGIAAGLARGLAVEDVLKLAAACGTANAMSKGKIFINDKEVAIRSPRDAKKHKIALLTEERRATGIFPILSVLDNTAVAHLTHYLNKFHLIDDKKRKTDASEHIKKMNIKTPSFNTLIQSLSGGNQQKVLVARWLLTDPDILLLDEPTRGIDVGAKYEIYMIINNLVEQGKSVIMVRHGVDKIVFSSTAAVYGEPKRVPILEDDETNPTNTYGETKRTMLGSNAAELLIEKIETGRSKKVVLENVLVPRETTGPRRR